jgi:hypothetical protein
VDVPNVSKDSEIDEKDFRKILDWCDIWNILLKTTGKLNMQFALWIYL